jgi:hypothetical protein
MPERTDISSILIIGASLAPARPSGSFGAVTAIPRLAAIAALLCVPAPATAGGSSYVAKCSAFLTETWRQEEAVHPIDRSAHIPVVLIDVPLHGLPGRYDRPIAALKETFPSFEEGPASGILTGCCAMPTWGSISFEDLNKLSEAAFVPLCALARRSRSTVAMVRMEYRVPYAKGEEGDPYFYIYWRRKPFL